MGLVAGKLLIWDVHLLCQADSEDACPLALDSGLVGLCFIRR